MKFFSVVCLLSTCVVSYSQPYLPLSGGALTGNLTINGGNQIQAPYVGFNAPFNQPATSNNVGIFPNSSSGALDIVGWGAGWHFVPSTNNQYPASVFSIDPGGNTNISGNTYIKGTLSANGGSTLGTNAVVNTTDGALSIGNIHSSYTPVTSNWAGAGSTLILSATDYSVVAFHHAGVRVDFIRAGNGTIQLGYDGGWGQANIGLPNGVWNSSGNVGIGTVNPDQKLTVNGTIHATQVLITANVPVPDYVFDKDYKLRSLADLKNYILLNKHLPEVSSAKEMQQTGINVNEINMKLLQKVEELTLYLIEKDKEMKELNQRLYRLEHKEASIK